MRNFAASSLTMTVNPQVSARLSMTSPMVNLLSIVTENSFVLQPLAARLFVNPNSTTNTIKNFTPVLCIVFIRLPFFQRDKIISFFTKI